MGRGSSYAPVTLTPEQSQAQAEQTRQNLFNAAMSGQIPFSAYYAVYPNAVESTVRTPAGVSGSVDSPSEGGLGSVVSDIGKTAAGAAKTFGPMVISAYIPIIGEAIGSELASAGLVSSEIATSVGTALAQTAVSVAQGVPLDQALTNSIVNTLVSTGSSDAADALNNVIDNPDVANMVVSAVGSGIKTAAAGGSVDDILTNAVAGAVGTGVADLTDSGAVGAVASSLITGADPTLASFAGELKDYQKDVSADQKEIDKTLDSAATDTVTGVTGTDVVADDGTTQGVQDVIDTLTGATGLDLIQQTGQDTVVGGEATTQGAAGVDTITDTTGTDVTSADTTVGATGEDTISATQTDVIADDGTTEGIQETIDTITGAGGEDTLVSGQDLAADATAGDTLDDISTALTEPATEEDVVTEEEAPPEDKTRKPMVVSGKKTTTAPATSTYLLGTVLQQPSSLAQSLTSYRGAGELESKSTGKPRKNVWNEASLRLKDALGL